MSKYIIHACPGRMRYVENYLVPSMKKQDIGDISIKCDDNHRGCLDSCMQIFMSTYGDGGAWHMQDDVVICRDFKKRTEDYDGYDGIVCGFAYIKDENANHYGLVQPSKMWWSFPCIYIPNNIARECAKWFYTKGRNDSKYAKWTNSNKYDDAFFKEFITLSYPDISVLNMTPNLVDHVDYLIGGSIANKLRSYQTRSKYFEDLYLVDELEKKLQLNNY